MNALHPLHFSRYDYPWLRLGAAFVAGLLAFVLTSGFGLERRALYVWDASALTLLALAWWVILSSSAEYTRQSARRQDLGGRGVGLLAIASSMVSLGVVVVVFPHAQKDITLEQVVLSVLAIALAWLVVHTTYVFRYAHLYHTHEGGRGLSFAEDQEPDFVDFAYFALNLGMAYQVADIVPETRSMRRQVLAHALLSYTFGTVIVAVTINLLASLL